MNKQLLSLILLAGLVGLSLVGTARAGSLYGTGDVFAAVGNSTVIEYTPTGTLVQTLNDGSGTAFTSCASRISTSSIARRRLICRV